VTKSIEKRSYICVSGYGWTGSSACIDLLKEFKGFGALDGEFRIARDPYGLRDLEESLVHNWDFIRHDVAIRDFLNYCKVLSRETGLFSQVGRNFSNKLNIDFMSESKSYINKLTDMIYLGDTFIHRYNIPAHKNFFMKIRSKFGKNNAKPMYLSRPDKAEFIKETRKYINNLFSVYMDFKRINTLILDQSIPPTNINNTSQYFENIKIIIIDRDPRDIYVNMVRSQKLLGPELIKKDSVGKYIKWHKQLRHTSIDDNYNCNKDVLRMNFEDLVLKYDDSIEKINFFIGNDAQHNDKGVYFLPEYSVKNIEIWKRYQDQSIMKEIGAELEEYCYNG